ncbi:STAS domain-containing protein [Vampirovibrio chlorellavorus]|uniref:STAS domain-containing protein n=1 Tax=Vampirovibrio chlorellavorus TaxID=758823 RepID=UPI0026EF2387|nr:STAS domain-containing protein [Vampirovibrio chlorellavorus]
MQTVVNEKELRLISEENFNSTFIDALQKKMLEAINANPDRDVVLDMRQVELIDSLGLKLLIGLYKTCQSQNRLLKLEVVNPSVLKVIRVCKLEQLIHLEEN